MNKFPAQTKKSSIGTRGKALPRTNTNNTRVFTGGRTYSPPSASAPLWKKSEKNIPRIKGTKSLIACCSLVILILISAEQSNKLRRKLSSWKEAVYSTTGLALPSSSSSSSSRQQPISLLLGIFSETGMDHEAQREFIRKTYLDIGDDRICTLSEFVRQTEEDYYRVCTVPYTFVIGAGGDNQPTTHLEDELSPLTVETDSRGNVDSEGPVGDCTYLNIRENINDGKSPTYMKFAAQIADEYGIDYISKMNQFPASLSMYHLFQFMNDDLPMAPYNRRMYGGSPVVSYKHDSIYASGRGFYFVSADLAAYVGLHLSPEERTALADSKNPAEDMDMGSFIYSNPNPIKFVNLSSANIFSHNLMSSKNTIMDKMRVWEIWNADEKVGQLYNSINFPFFDLYCDILSGDKRF
uniref:Hexosyltransferase n=2 Tax=Chaetoceros debilis TaxID=122233 RepID=A0A6S8XEK2_9STRA|mmetsp:Transcript_29321/g.44749  ORF Transcript_29321/g.44749 Transcript_29321/m.44749 type:complete len:409 (+) Transcript_29321:99-1325(+)